MRRRGLNHNDDTLELLHQVYEDVPQLLLKLLNRHVTPTDLRDKAESILRL